MSHSSSKPVEIEQSITTSRVSVTANTIPDGGWGWVVCVSSFWCNGVIFGMLTTFSVMYPDLLRTFNQDNNSDLGFRTSWIGSLATGFTFLMSPVAAILADRFGIRPVASLGAILSTVGLLSSSFVTRLELLYLTYGTLLGFGSAFTYITSIIVLGKYFDKRLGLANGFATFGTAAFVTIMPFVMKQSLVHVGLKYTFLLLAGIHSTAFLCTLTYRPLQDHQRARFVSSTSLNDSWECTRRLRKFLNVRIWRNRNYLIWAIAMFISFMGYNILLVHLVQFAKEIFEEENNEILVTCLGISSGVGRLSAGKLADFRKISRVRLLQCSFVGIGIMTATLPFSTYFGVLVALILILGIFDGCMICLVSPVAYELVGAKNASQAIGFINGVIALPMMIGPPIAGFMHDVFGNYDAAFWLAGAPCFLGATLLFLIPPKDHEVVEMQEMLVTTVEDKDIERGESTSKSSDREKEPVDAERNALL